MEKQTYFKTNDLYSKIYKYLYRKEELKERMVMLSANVVIELLEKPVERVMKKRNERMKELEKKKQENRELVKDIEKDLRRIPLLL